jgi:hypothetical protein
METHLKALQKMSAEISNAKDIVATFNLTPECIESIKWLSKRFRLSKKKLFDSYWNTYDESLFKIFKENNLSHIEFQNKRIKMSQRISKNSLVNLDTLAKKFRMKRDDIIILTFTFMRTVNETEQKKRNINNMKALEFVDELWAHAEKVEKTLSTQLEEDDPILERIGKIIGVIMHLSTAIQDEIENGVIIDPEDM